MKKTSLKKLKDKAWSLYSKYIRISNANQDGFVECVTCYNPKPMPWKKIQAGHFVSGRSARILFAENNVFPQCYCCNCILSGNWPNYYKFMKQKFGLKVINKLLALKDEDKSNPMSSGEVSNLCERIISLYGHYKNE